MARVELAGVGKLMDTPYIGYSMEVIWNRENGSGTERVYVKHRAWGDVIDLEIDGGIGEQGFVRLSVEDARRLATTLLRDVCLIEDGSG